MYLIRWREIRIIYIRILETSFSIFLYFELNEIQISKTNKNPNIYFVFQLIDFQKQIDKKYGI